MSWFSIQELEYLLRIVLAAVCGGAIGFERERRSKSAGIRTHIIVALSAALMMVVSKYGFFDVIGLGGISLDASRVAAGVVTWSGRKNGYGNVVEVGHADGYTTLYAHNQKNLVEVGDLVKRGQVLAKVGSTGRSTGYHVHFEVMKDGRVMNPQSFIARASVSE